MVDPLEEIVCYDSFEENICVSNALIAKKTCLEIGAKVDAFLIALGVLGVAEK